jgi:ribosomal protein L31
VTGVQTCALPICRVEKFNRRYGIQREEEGDEEDDE